MSPASVPGEHVAAAGVLCRGGVKAVMPCLAGAAI